MAWIHPFSDTLIQHGIKLVVFDFDSTILSHHTGGSIKKENLKEYQKLVSSDAITLINHLLDLPDGKIHVGIGSFAFTLPFDSKDRFSGQDMIRRILKPHVPKLSQIPIEAKLRRSKEPHLLALGAHFHVKPKDILLIDDSIHNIEDAFNKGYWTMHVEGSDGFRFTSGLQLKKKKPRVASQK